MPLHSRIRAFITEAVAAGRLKPGDQIPSQRELGEMFQASHMTVRRAIDELLAEGVLFAVRGKGLYVHEGKKVAEAGALVSFSEDMARRGLQASSRLLAAGEESAAAILALALGVPAGAPLYYIQRLRYANAEPMAVQSSWLRADLCPGLLRFDFARCSLFQVLKEKYRLDLATGEGVVGASLAGEQEAEWLGISLPSALLVSERVTALADGTPVEFVRSVYRGDRYQMRLK